MTEPGAKWSEKSITDFAKAESHAPALDGELIDPDRAEIDVPYGKGPFSPEETAQIGRWIAKGVSRNELVRRTGRANATLTRLAQANGWEYNRTRALSSALASRVMDFRTERQDLKEKLLNDARRLREQLWRPTELVMLNNRTGEFARTILTEPNFADKRNIMTAIGIAVDKVTDLERLDAPQEGRQAIITLVDSLRLTVKLDKGEALTDGDRD